MMLILWLDFFKVLFELQDPLGPGLHVFYATLLPHLLTSISQWLPLSSLLSLFSVKHLLNICTPGQVPTHVIFFSMSPLPYCSQQSPLVLFYDGMFVCFYA